MTRRNRPARVQATPAGRPPAMPPANPQATTPPPTQPPPGPGLADSDELEDGALDEELLEGNEEELGAEVEGPEPAAAPAAAPAAPSERRQKTATGAAAPTPSELAVHVDDRISKVFVVGVAAV
ncbi:MAG: hypothetical protein H6Q36_1853, partial [Chloroflexi bacterium]|nr:hypothetical protein [Chloroflexota bacterium]